MEDLKYEDEELEEIEYFEILTFDEIIKINPNIVLLNDEDILKYLYNFFKSKEKSKGFLKLFNSIIEKQSKNINIKNFIIVLDAMKGNFKELSEDNITSDGFILNDFITKIKNTLKEQIEFSYKNKNKIWFPLIYDNETSKIKFSATNKTLVQLSTNDYYIIYKDDDRDIPIISIYFYEPNVDDNTYLNEKIISHLIKPIDRFKGEHKLSSDYNNLNDMIKDYKIELPLNKIDKDEYQYSSLSNLFNKFNYDLDFINLDDYEVLKSFLTNLNKKEKEIKINYSPLKEIKEHDLTNKRFLFYEILKKTNGLIDITYNSSKKLQIILDTIKTEKNFIESLPIHTNLNILINNINNDNYDEIIKNLRDIRKNISIDNSVAIIEKFLNLKPEEITLHFEKIENKFNLLKTTYKDIFKIQFTFEEDIKEIKKGIDINNYEGIPIKVGELKPDIFEYNEVEIDDEYTMDNLEKYYNNPLYLSETGFCEALTYVLPFVIKMQEYTKLPVNLDVITNHLFNIYRGIPKKYDLIREKYKDKFDEDHCKEQNLKSIQSIFNNENEDQLLKDAIIEYIAIINDMLYDIICKWSIELQRELIDETLIYDKNIYYIPCFDLWNNTGCPYDTLAKDGIFYYLICIFSNVFKEIYTDEYSNNYLVLDKNYKSKAFERLLNKYEIDLKDLKKVDIKKIKINKGIEAQKELVKFLQTKDYNNDKFFETFIQSLLYMPSVKYVKIHKYLLGCCLETLDENFTADKFFKTNRKDLEKAKTKFSSDRVMNKKRYTRFYLSKLEVPNKQKRFKAIKYEKLLYPIYDKSLEKWFSELDETTILTNTNIGDIKERLLYSYNIHINEYLKFFDKKIEDYKENNLFMNYKQILNNISKILYLYLKDNGFYFIHKINKTIDMLNKLNSIINDDNDINIQQIRIIIVIRALCIPCVPEIKTNAKLIPSITMSSEDYKNIFNDIKINIFKLIDNAKMPNEEEQKDYINSMREGNKAKILKKLHNKSKDEIEVYKQLKSIGLEYTDMDDEEKPIVVNTEISEEIKDIEGENEFNLETEDNDFDYFEKEEYGKIYSS